MIICPRDLAAPIADELESRLRREHPGLELTVILVLADATGWASCVRGDMGLASAALEKATVDVVAGLAGGDPWPIPHGVRA